MKKYFPLILVLLFLFPSLLFAGGIKFSGDRLDTLTMTFDSAGVDRSTPESTARGFLKINLQMSLDPYLKGLIDELTFHKKQSLFSGLLSKEGQDQVLGREKKFLQVSKNLAGQLKYSYKIKTLEQTKLPSGAVEVTFQVSAKSIAPCHYCSGTGRQLSQKKATCPQCKGKKVLTRVQNYRTKVTLVSGAQGWRIRWISKTCSRCGGKSSSRCPRCRGKGMVRENPPKLLLNLTKNFPPLPSSSSSPVKNSPQKLVRLFLTNYSLSMTISLRIISRLAPTVNEIFRFFFHPSSLSSTSSPPYQPRKYTLVKTSDLPEGKKLVVVSFVISKKITVLQKFILVFQNGWKIHQILDQCWRCKGTGKDSFTVRVKKYTCPNHPSFQTYSKKASCSKCGNKNLIPIPRPRCPECHGKGYTPTLFLF